mmetsp:Transcript_62572/g.179485  ORF Transcript_62572/g.179485 Transcript_62572/m.179485 type:complete len:210 (+) Transcript_62572:461-1090(+)
MASSLTSSVVLWVRSKPWYLDLVMRSRPQRDISKKETGGGALSSLECTSLSSAHSSAELGTCFVGVSAPWLPPARTAPRSALRSAPGIGKSGAQGSLHVEPPSTRPAFLGEEQLLPATSKDLKLGLRFGEEPASSSEAAVKDRARLGRIGRRSRVASTPCFWKCNISSFCTAGFCGGWVMPGLGPSRPTSRREPPGKGSKRSKKFQLAA